MPGLHPRMASEQHGPNANRMLEPPGFMALNYGIQTPVSVFLAHAVFGAILGSLYHLVGQLLNLGLSLRLHLHRFVCPLITGPNQLY